MTCGGGFTRSLVHESCNLSQINSTLKIRDPYPNTTKGSVSIAIREIKDEGKRRVVIRGYTIGSRQDARPSNMISALSAPIPQKYYLAELVLDFHYSPLVSTQGLIS